MRGLQEAVCVTPPASSTDALDQGKGNKLAVTTASSGEQTIPSPGWWSFFNDGGATLFNIHIAFYTKTGALAAAVVADWPLPAAQIQQYYIDMEPTVASGQAYRFFKVIGDGAANLYWYRSSR